MKHTLPQIFFISLLFVFYPFSSVFSMLAISEAVQMSSNIPSRDEAKRLSKLAMQKYKEGYLKEALRLYLEELEVRRSINDRIGEARSLGNIGSVYRELGDKHKAVDYYGQSLILSRSIPSREVAVFTLNGIAALYDDMGDRQKALDYYKQALPIMKLIRNRGGEGLILSNMAAAYNNLGERQKALDFYSQALPLIRADKAFDNEANALNGMGLVYFRLGEKQKALEYYIQALSITRKIQDRRLESYVLANIAGVYSSFGETYNAIDYFGKALLLVRSIPDPRAEAVLLNNIGNLYGEMGDFQKALNYYEQSLPLIRSVQDYDGEAITITNIARINYDLGRTKEALEYYNIALPLMVKVHDRDGESSTFANIGLALSKESHPELAIVFYKQSISILELLRKDIKGLPKSTQKKYIQSVSGRYRSLADLLLKENRILEAEQILDLLKVQELDDIFRDVRGNNITQLGPIFLQPEQEILKRFNTYSQSAVQLGQELSQLQNFSKNGLVLTPEQRNREAELDHLLSDIKSQFIDFLNSPDIQEFTTQLTKADQQQIPLTVFDKLRKNLKTLGNAALVYPLVLDDRIELIVTVPDAPPLRRTVKVSRLQLNEAIINYRNVLEHPDVDAKPLAQKLYSWLIQPIEADLKQANTKTILYAPDGPLRYLPLPALYDGKQWLAQKYAVNNITAVSLSELNSSSSPPPRLLAGAFSDKNLRYKVPIGDDAPLIFHGLPFAGIEVDNLSRVVPLTVKRTNKAFSLKTLKPTFSEYNILHFATHSAFFPGRPEDSFILFGDGERATLRSVENWSLSGVDLVVLSTCQSALGIAASPCNPKISISKLGNGSEYLGLGYVIQQAGAQATIASLWTVDDGGTQVLMSEFYALLNQGNISKVEALRQAQVKLITRNQLIDLQSRDAMSTTKGISQAVVARLDHPHYWAPFILIGNGL
jgi:CHAT domain-containing protein/tetratricopeptide (TPR) repeat protein